LGAFHSSNKHLQTSRNLLSGHYSGQHILPFIHIIFAVYFSWLNTEPGSRRRLFSDHRRVSETAQNSCNSLRGAPHFKPAVLRFSSATLA
jgi:hypothetical protein